MFCNSRAPAAEPCAPDSRGRGGETHEEGRRGGGEGREEGRSRRSPLTCSAVPRARPAAQPDRTPGMRPRYGRQGGQRAPAGTRGRKRAMGAAPEPPPASAQHGPAQPAPPRDAPGDGMEPPEPGARSPGAGARPRAWPRGSARRGQRRLPRLSRDGNAPLRLHFVPEFYKTGLKSVFRALGKSGKQQSPPSLLESEESARSSSEPRWARAQGQPLRTPPALPDGNRPVAFLSS